MNKSDGGLIEKLKLVTWKFVNCVVPDGGFNIYKKFCECEIMK